MHELPACLGVYSPLVLVVAVDGLNRVRMKVGHHDWASLSYSAGRRFMRFCSPRRAAHTHVTEYMSA